MLDTIGEEQPIIALLASAIELSPSAKYAEYYFNPLFAKELLRILPQLGDLGFVFEVSEFDEDGTTHVSATIQHKDKVLPLGELIFKGEGIKPSEKNKLQPINKVVNFISTCIEIKGG